MSAKSDWKQFKKPSADVLKKELTKEQYNCTQTSKTEPPFQNKYWNHHEDGIYVDVVSGEPLFSSLDKYDSGSGWPSFTGPIDVDSLQQKEDKTLGMSRTEIRSKLADSHLGHVFNDGPGPSGKRYCINSSALRFVSLSKMRAEGYGKYLFAFAAKNNWDVATLSGGCFWGMEDLFREIPGVVETQVGYSGGDFKSPQYSDVKTGKTGHAEALQILFDPKIVSYDDILIKFFKIHDPTTPDRQGNDVGSQYRSAIFYSSEVQKNKALKIRDRVVKSDQWKNKIVTEISILNNFYRAEDFHQKYLQRNPAGYTCHFERKISF